MVSSAGGSAGAVVGCAVVLEAVLEVVLEAVVGSFLTGELDAHALKTSINAIINVISLIDFLKLLFIQVTLLKIF